MAYKLSLQIAPCELAIQTDSQGKICSDNLLGLAESHRVNGKIVTTFVGQTELFHVRVEDVKLSLQVWHTSCHYTLLRVNWP